MIKKLLVLPILLFIVFGLTACKSINRVDVDHESIEELQILLPELYYFDFLKEDIEFISYRSHAILTQTLLGKDYEYFRYSIYGSLRLDTEIVTFSINAFKHNSRDFVVSESRISSEYQNASQREDFIEELTIDGIRCMIYGDTTIFFWINEQQYTITMHKAIDQESFTVSDFISIVELAITNRYRIE